MMESPGRYALLCIDKGEVYCSDYTDDLVIAKAWETENSIVGIVSNGFQIRWFDDTQFNADAKDS